MKSNKKDAAEVKTVTKAEKKNAAPISEVQVREFVDNHIFELILMNVASEKWDGQPLEEDRVYHLLKLGGIRIYWIKDNRRTWKRALKMLNACQKNGMTTPAIITDAKIAADWGLPLIDPATCEDVVAEKLEGAYCVMEGHGRFWAWIIALALMDKTGVAPFDYHFVYKHYETSEEFGKAYVSTNADMTRTTSKDRLNIAGARSKDPMVVSYLSKTKEDYVIPKASNYWTFGRELSTSEVSKLIYGEEDAPKFDKDLTDALTLCYESIKSRFGAKGAEKIYRGVSAAQWCAAQLKDAEDKGSKAMMISEKVEAMGIEIYTAILTASTNKKKHITRDQVIKTNLDMMMK